jgi:hypothetical protein
MAELSFVQIGIKSSFSQQLSVRTAFNDVAKVQNQDQVCG